MKITDLVGKTIKTVARDEEHWAYLRITFTDGTSIMVEIEEIFDQEGNRPINDL